MGENAEHVAMNEIIINEIAVLEWLKVELEFEVEVEV